MVLVKQIEMKLCSKCKEYFAKKYIKNDTCDKCRDLAPLEQVSENSVPQNNS